MSSLNESNAGLLSEAAYNDVKVFDRNIDGWHEITDTLQRETNLNFFNKYIFHIDF